MSVFGEESMFGGNISYIGDEFQEQPGTNGRGLRIVTAKVSGLGQQDIVVAAADILGVSTSKASDLISQIQQGVKTVEAETAKNILALKLPQLQIVKTATPSPALVTTPSEFPVLPVVLGGIALLALVIYLVTRKKE